MVLLMTVERLSVTRVSYGTDLVFWLKMKYLLISNPSSLLFVTFGNARTYIKNYSLSPSGSEFVGFGYEYL